MNTTHIPFAGAGFSKLLTDYLTGAAHLQPFYKYKPELASFNDIIEAKKQVPVNRQVLSAVLEEQYQRSGLQSTQIEKLRNDNTFTVTTGHQLNIFTGPLYFVAKILTTIRLADTLKQTYPAYNFVPVYWMASEDHDIEEINHTSVYGKPVVWDTAQKGPAGRLSTADMQAALEQLFILIGETNSDIKALVEAAYVKQSNLADATRVLVDALFGKYGLLVLDADDTRLKKTFASLMLQDIIQQHSYKLVGETTTALSQLYKTQVQPREINFFYIKNGLRERIVEEAGVYKVLNTDISFTQQQLKEAIENDPACFSPNVVTRPLYQEFILPNLAYIGGPAEVAYWMQYKAMFDHYKVNFPMLVIRNCLLWIDEATSNKMSKLGLEVNELFTETDQLINAYIKRTSTHQVDFEQEKVQLEQLFAGITEKIAMVESTLKATAEAEKSKALAAVAQLNDKLIKAIKRKEETTVGQIRTIKDKLFPGGVLQERVDNFIPFYVKQGPAFFDTLLENFSALPADFLVYHHPSVLNPVS